jgi:hypothetical protein
LIATVVDRTPLMVLRELLAGLLAVLAVLADRLFLSRVASVKSDCGRVAANAAKVSESMRDIPPNCVLR